MTNFAVVQQTMDRVVVQDLERALDFMAQDVELTVLLPAVMASTPETLQGKKAVRDYFGALGGIVTFWRVELVCNGDQVLVLGQESYVTNSGMESDSDFMLVCQVRNGLIVRIVVMEDLTAEAPLRPTVWRGAHRMDDALLEREGACGPGEQAVSLSQTHRNTSRRKYASLPLPDCERDRAGRHSDSGLFRQLRTLRLPCHPQPGRAGPDGYSPAQWHH